MARMAILLPYQELLAPVEEMFGRFSHIAKHSVIYLRPEKVEAYVHELELEGCDIIMARGLYAELARHASRLPVVEMRITAQELGELVMELREDRHTGDLRIGLIGEKLMLCDTPSFLHLCQAEILRYEIEDVPNAAEAMRLAVGQAYRDGCGAVIGGQTVCAEAARLGMSSRFIYTGQESLYNSFNIAQHVAYAIDQAKSNRAEIETMLNFTSSGIVRVDVDGMILWTNTIASELLGLPSQRLLGGRLTEIFPALSAEQMDKALTEGQEVYTILLPPSRKETVVNIVPILVEERITGAILTFHEGRRIIAMNSELQQELYHHGFLARWTFDQLPACSGNGRETIRQAKLVAKYSAPILLTGSAGSGKEILAQCIHNSGVTHGNAFIPLDCLAYNSDTLDTMLFGNY